METYYKILRGGRSCHGGTHVWEQGVTYEVDEVIPGLSGFHACRIQDLSKWITYDMEIWEIEFDGDIVTEFCKVVGRTARLTKQLGSFTMEKQEEFSRWCADRAVDADAYTKVYDNYYAGIYVSYADACAKHADVVVKAIASAYADANAVGCRLTQVERLHGRNAANAANAARDNARVEQGKKILELLS